MRSKHHVLKFGGTFDTYVGPTFDRKPFNFKVGGPGGKQSEMRQIDHSKCPPRASSRMAKFLHP